MAEERGLTVRVFNAKEIVLIKSTIAVGATDDELELFLIQCRRTGLDPFSRQIHAIKRWNSEQNKQVMTIQVGIDGSRLIAERTGTYAPGKQPTFEIDGEGNLISATAYGWKLVAGTWFDVSATAYYAEYVQELSAKKGGGPTSFWRRMPRGQLAKCAEALLLRKCCPQELSGLYTDDEMGQADNEPEQPAQPKAPMQAQRSQPAPQRQQQRDKISEMHPTDTQLAGAWRNFQKVANEKPGIPYTDIVAPLRGKAALELTIAEVQAVGRALREWTPEPPTQEEQKAEPAQEEIPI